MTRKEINRLLGNKINNCKITEIFRDNIDEFSSLGNIILVTDEILVFENIVDFSVNGYKVIRLKDVTAVNDCDKNDSLKFLNMILNKEKIIGNNIPVFQFKNIHELFKTLVTTNNPVTVECSFEDAIDYYVGWIKSVTNNIATMQCFDGGGILFKEEVKVNLDFVSSVSINDRYTDVMSKYVK